MTISRQRSTGRCSSGRRDRALRSVDDAEAHVAKVCFQTGPPRLLGVELEWIVHHQDDPARRLDPVLLRAALGPHAPRSLDPASPHQPLPNGGLLTVEPGGQVEISCPPQTSLAALHRVVHADLTYLRGRLGRLRLTLGHTALDSGRRPSRLLSTPRYDAMASAFARDGDAGLEMMCSTAGLQVCLDAGQPHRVAARWAAVHALGPVLLAAFANSPDRAGADTGWASARMAVWLDMHPGRTRPIEACADPALAWARYALRAPLVCVRRPDGIWHAPADATFTDWINGALPHPPTIDDLDYHLSTLFPPVRPRGYLEVRYLDTQPPREWIAPVAVLTVLLATEAMVDKTLELCEPAVGRWTEAARRGLGAPVLGETARRVLDLACRRLDLTDLSPAQREDVATTIGRRLAGPRARAEAGLT